MKPYIVIHNTMSVDGRLDWFKPDVELYYEIASRFQEDATLVGSGTILNPYEQVDIPKEDDGVFEKPEIDPHARKPILVIPDSGGRIRVWHYLRSLPYWRNWIALCSKSTPSEHLDYLQKRHINCIINGEDKVHLKEALEELNLRYNVKNIRVDSGGTLNGVLLRLGLVDEISVLVNPSLVGGKSPKSVFNAPDLNSAGNVIELKLVHLEKRNNDTVWLKYKVIRK